MKFKVICSKENQKLTLSLEAVDATEARNILHNQGYSIIEINIDEWEELVWNFFYFDIRVDNQIKSWQIQSNDIFKAYKKLVQDLGHDIVYIYTMKNMPEEQKKIITWKVKSGYELYINNTRTQEDVDQEEKASEKDINADVYDQISPEMKREIEKYNKIIDDIILKLQNIVIKYNNALTPDRKQKFEQLQQALYQSKSSTNIWKLKTIGETALIKIGEVELDLVRLEVGEERKKFFETTNKLLREVGSKSKFWIKEVKTIPPILIKIWDTLKSFTKQANTIIEENSNKPVMAVDKSSFAFYKNLRELKIYKDLLKSTELLIFTRVFHLEFSEVKRLFLKRKLLSQNIQIITNRIDKKNFSYTKIVRGFGYYIHVLLSVIAYVGDILLYALVLYSIGFVIYLLLNKVSVSIDIRDNLSFFISILSGFILTTRFYHHIILFSVVFSLFLGFIYFLTINF